MIARFMSFYKPGVTCVTVHNIGQISHLIILSQQQAFKLCQSKKNMRTQENYSKDKHQRRKRIPFFSLAAALALSCSLEALTFIAELSCSKDSIWASRSLTFSDCSREDFSRAAIFSSYSTWSADNRRSFTVRRRNSACSATCLARTYQQNTVKTKVLNNSTKNTRVQKTLTVRAE